jgi:GcrA cell cycle regulator
MTTQQWNEERVEQLRSCVSAGLTCSQIAKEIGVTRNAVIGKIHRLGLAPGRRPARAVDTTRAERVRAGPLARRRMLRALLAEAPRVIEQPTAEAAIVDSAQRCSLIELAPGKCRWPINDPGAADFGFCGNAAMSGLSYCTGHARMAYRLPVRRRA